MAAVATACCVPGVESAWIPYRDPVIRMRAIGRRDRTYTVRVKNLPYPVFLRGGRSTDSTALYEVFITGEYALPGVSEPPAFIIDGGDNVGMASLYFLDRYPAARAIAVEPDPANFEICRRNLRPYGDRVNVIQGAIWETEGRLGLKQNPNGDEWSTKVRNDNSGPVKALTMPWLLAQSDGQIGLLKLDIEGSEAQVFAAGTMATLGPQHSDRTAW